MPRKRPAAPWLDTRGGVYYAFWYNPDKRQRESVSLRTTDLEAAKSLFAEFLTQGSALYGSSRLHALTVPAALDDYLKEHCQTNVADYARQRMSADNLKKHFACEVKLIDIPMCRLYVERRLSGEICGKGHRKVHAARAASPSTARRELVVLTAAINHAVKWKRMPRADVPFIELPAESKAKERWLTHDEMTKLRTSLRQHITALAGLIAERPGDGSLRQQSESAQRTADFTEIAYYTASRAGAVETLTRFQVNLKQGRIKLAKDGERKTKKRRPVVRIDPELRPTLERLIDTATNEWVLGSPAKLYRPFVKACERAGIEGVSPHTLRHTRATHLLQNGVSIWDVAGLLGDTVATVERVYGHHATDYQAETETKRETDRS